MLRIASIGALLLLACRSNQPPSPPTEPIKTNDFKPLPNVVDLRWTVASPNGHATLELRKGKERSMLGCSIDGAPDVWLIDGATFESAEVRFVSNDCRRAVLMHPLPSKRGSWSNTIVLRVLKDGVVDEELTGAALGADTTGQRFRWLAGVLGERGEAPHYSDDGAFVEYQVITLSGRVDRFAALTDEAKPRQPINPHDATLYGWEDEKGVMQYAQGLDHVPAAFRKKAHKVDAVLSTLPSPDAEAVDAGRPLTQEELLMRLQAQEYARAMQALEAARMEALRAAPSQAPPPPDDDTLTWATAPDGRRYVVPTREPPPPGTSCHSAGESCRYASDCCSGKCGRAGCE